MKERFKKEKYGLHSSLRAKTTKGDELLEILLKASNLLAATKGLKYYLLSREEKNFDTIWISELWECKEDHENSLKNPEIRALIHSALPLIEGQSRQELKVLAAVGISD